jgi:hypothetical protein
VTTGINQIVPDGDTGFAEDIIQFAKIFTGAWDGGAMSLLQPLATPSVAPTVNTSSSGAISGSGYQWGYYWITGTFYKTQPPSPVYTPTQVGTTPYGTLTSSQNLSSKEAVVSISGITVPTGAIGWGVVRNKSGGGTWYEVPNSQQFLSSSGSMPSSFTDNSVDSALVTTAPTVNTTGTTITNVPSIAARTTAPVSISQHSSEWSLISNATQSSTTGLYVPPSVISVNSWMRFRFHGGYFDNYGSIYTNTVNFRINGNLVYQYQNTNETGTDGQVNPIVFEVDLLNLDSLASNWYKGLAIVGKATGTNEISATYPSPQFFGYSSASGGAWNLNTAGGVTFDVTQYGTTVGYAYMRGAVVEAF